MRSRVQKAKDFLLFPLRAFTLFYEDAWGLSCQATERFDYVASAVQGRCLDVGCGLKNRFIEEFCRGNGVGIDVFAYDGLTSANLVTDMTKLPYSDGSFDTVTFIANLNHVPKSLRDLELAEAFRVLRPGGNVVVTMGNPLAEILVHQVVWLHDRITGSKQDLDSIRGMHEDEEYYLTTREITGRLKSAGFQNISCKYFTTQWFLNHMFIGWKTSTSGARSQAA